MSKTREQILDIINSEEGLVIQDKFRDILRFVGENPEREGLKETPKRFLNYLKETLDKKEFSFTTFSGEGYDQMIIVKNIPFYSFCEHHIAPIIGTATVAYVPNDKIVGLSKIPRTVKYYASNLQNQERITTQVAERLDKELQPKGVAVYIKARHMCMEMRGVKVPNTETITTKLIGCFKDETSARAEFMSAIKE